VRKIMAALLALSIMVSAVVLWSQEVASAHGGAWEGLPASQDKDSPQTGHYIATQAGFPPTPSPTTTVASSGAGPSSGAGKGQEVSPGTSSGTSTTSSGKSSGPYNGPINGTFNGTAGPGGTACCGTVNGTPFAGGQQNQTASTCSGCTVNGNFNGTLNGTTVGNQFNGTINGTFNGTVNGTLSNAGGVGGPTSSGYPTTGQVQNAVVTGTPVKGTFSGDPDTGDGSHGAESGRNGDK
jgi:hypothetical protein